jgi:hypothetical protein
MVASGARFMAGDWAELRDGVRRFRLSGPGCSSRPRSGRHWPWTRGFSVHEKSNTSTSREGSSTASASIKSRTQAVAGATLPQRRRSGSLAGSGHPGCSCPVAAAPGSACREHQTALFDASRKPAGGGRYGEVHTHRGESRRRPGRPRLPHVGGLWASEARSTGQREKAVSCGGTVRRKGGPCADHPPARKG